MTAVVGNDESIFSNESCVNIPADIPFAVVIVICPTPVVGSVLNQSFVLTSDLNVTGTGLCTVHVQH